MPSVKSTGRETPECLLCLKTLSFWRAKPYVAIKLTGLNQKKIAQYYKEFQNCQLRPYRSYDSDTFFRGEFERFAPFTRTKHRFNKKTNPIYGMNRTKYMIIMRQIHSAIVVFSYKSNEDQIHLCLRVIAAYETYTRLAAAILDINDAYEIIHGFLEGTLKMSRCNKCNTVFTVTSQIGTCPRCALNSLLFCTKCGKPLPGNIENYHRKGPKKKLCADCK